MLLNLLTSAQLDKYNYKPEIPEVLLYALMGFAVVFLGIAFLVFTVWLVGYLMKKTKDKTAKPVPSSVNILSSSKPSDELDEETIAVIMAAITAFYQTNNPKCEFTVKRIKRVRRNDYA